MVVDGLLNLAVPWDDKAHYFLPFLGSMFAFILASNYGAFPGAGSIPGIDTPIALECYCWFGHYSIHGYPILWH